MLPSPPPRRRARRGSDRSGKRMRVLLGPAPCQNCGVSVVYAEPYGVGARAWREDSGRIHRCQS